MPVTLKHWRFECLESGRQHRPPAHRTSKPIQRLFVQSQRRICISWTRVSRRLQSPASIQAAVQHRCNEQRNLLTSSFNQISRPLISVSSPSNSPIPSKQARTMISVHPGTFLTIFGPASDKLIINSKALRRRVERSSPFHFLCWILVRVQVRWTGRWRRRGGRLWRLRRRWENEYALPAIAFPGKGRPIVGVGPQSTGDNIKAGKNVSNETKWGEKTLECDVQSGASGSPEVQKECG